MVSLVAHKIPNVQSVLVSEENSGQRLDNFLITFLKGVPKTHVYRIIRKGEVRVNKGRIKSGYRLVSGDMIRIPPIRMALGAESLSVPKKQADLLKASVLYEDAGLIILNKPAGMAVHGGSGLSFGVIEALRKLRPEAKVLELVHRLDRDTSGCLMIAKRKSTLRCLHEQLKAAQIEKIYWVLVNGHWSPFNKIVDLPLLKNQLSSGERIVRVNTRGQQAVTEFKIIQRYTSETLLQAKPITGRTHQIRVHTQASGHFIAGDAKYGNPDFNHSMKQLGLNRLFLHARQLTLQLPETGTKLTIEAPLDDTLSVVLNHLSKDNAHV